MAAFRAASDLGFVWIETDVHATSDGVVLAFHDATLDRTTDGTGVIAEMTWAQVSQARIAGVEPIPRLVDVFEQLPGTHLNIDVKSDAAVEPLVEVIEQARAHDRVRVTSFSDARRRRALILLSKPVRTSPGRSSMAALWVASRFGRKTFAAALRRVAGAERMDALQVPERQGRLRVVDERLVGCAHAAGLEVHVWTVNDRPTMERLLDLGVDGIITDRADVLKDVLVARGEWGTPGVQG